MSKEQAEEERRRWLHSLEVQGEVSRRFLDNIKANTETWNKERVMNPETGRWEYRE